MWERKSGAVVARFFRNNRDAKVRAAADSSRLPVLDLPLLSIGQIFSRAMNARPKPIARAATRRARELRSAMTDAERLLWGSLRNRGLAGAKFRRQKPEGGYFVDFLCAQARLVVELDGGQHSEPEAERYDLARTRYLNAQGLRVIRFWNIDVIGDLHGVLDAVAAALAEEG